MSKELTERLKRTCRTCTLYFDNIAENFIPIFNNHNKECIIVKELNFLNILVQEDDGLPQIICTLCFDIIQNIYEFRNLAQKSQITLQEQFIHSTKPKEPEKVTSSIDFCIKNETKSIDFIDVSKEVKIEENTEFIHEDLDGNYCNLIDESSNQNLINLQNINDDDKPFKCWYCEKSFVSVKKLLTHEKNHKEEKPTKCNICGKNFKSMYDHQVHLRTHRIILSDIFQCEYCAEMFKTTSGLIKHLRKHENGKDPVKKPWLQPPSKESAENKRDKWKIEGEYICPICSKIFVIPQGLEKHLKLHDKNRKYRCQQCGLGYKRGDHLQRHINMSHTKTKFYSCPLCDKVFLDDATRSRHIRRHDNKVYPCQHCGKKLMTIESFRIHIRKHSNEKRYTCRICGEGFVQKSFFKYHQARHTKQQHQFTKEMIITNALNDGEINLS